MSITASIHNGNNLRAAWIFLAVVVGVCLTVQVQVLYRCTWSWRPKQSKENETGQFLQGVQALPVSEFERYAIPVSSNPRPGLDKSVKGFERVC